ncbi:MAG: flagellar hook-length control protein FliK [Candidatus Omnitrophica bacterium]|nr:flagellar hook-length control protein FliK [Candidatus Omnitrophota bacterium]
MAEELEAERPVDTPVRKGKENGEPTPLSQAEGSRSERSVEVLTNLEEGANPRHTEVEFHPQFVAAIQRVVEKVSNHPLRDQVIYNEGEKLAQRNREGDWVPSVKTEAAPNGSSVKNTEEVDVPLADSSEEVVPVAQSENRKVAETMVPAPEVMTASTPAGQKVPSEEPIVIPNPAKPATPTPNLIQPTEAETPKSPKPAPAPESASVESKPSAVVERKVIQVQVLAGDMAEKLEALSGRILETRTYRGHETQNPIRPEGTNQSREISSRSNPQNGTTNQAIVVETSAKSGEGTPKLATSQNPNPVITPRADSVTPTIKLSAESPEPTNGTLIFKPVSTEGKVANQETSVQNSIADNKPKIAPDAKRPVLSISEAAVDSTVNRPEPSQPDKRPVETVTRRPETVSTPVSKPTPSVVPDTQSEARVVRESLFATLTGQKESKKSEAKVTADEKAPRPEARATVAKPTSTTTASQPVTQSIAKPSIQAIVPPIELPKVAPDKSVETFNNSAEKSSPVIPVNETNSVVSRPTQTNPTPSLPPAPVEENEILNQISRNIQSRSVTQGSEMRIRLVPESLGEIHVKVMVRDGQVIAEIRASSDATREILTKNATHLQSLLAESGVGMEKVVVRTGNFGSDLQGQFTQQRDAGQQQDPKEGGRNQSNDPEGDRSQGREDSRKNPRRRAWERFV